MYVRPGFAAVHLIERDGRVAIVDTGANASVAYVVQALIALSISREAVDSVFLTHVHLDHAGGAGLLLQALPNARVVVHPRGVAHLIDPSRLAQATSAVYGAERFEQLYGSLVPIAAERIVPTADLDRLRVGKRELSVLHTPGHALHHQALFDPEASAIFTGDTFGLSYRTLDTSSGPFIVPTTTPTQFDPEQLLASIERLAALDPEAAYLTHFGRVTGVGRLARSLEQQVTELVQIALRHQGSAERQLSIANELRGVWLHRLERHGVEDAASRLDAVLGEDLELNAQGLVAWLERGERAARNDGSPPQ